MGHFFEELWRFKGLGILWALCLALIIIGLKEGPKYIENRQLLSGVVILLIFIFCFVCFFILISDKKSKENDVEKVVPTIDSTIPASDSSLSPTKIDTTSQIKTEKISQIEIDTISITQDFMLGTWYVVNDDSTINEEIRFTYSGFNKIKVSNNCSSSKIIFCNHPIDLQYNRLITRNFNQEAKLFLEKRGKKMAGYLKISDYDVYFLKVQSTKSYSLIFTKQ